MPIKVFSKYRAFVYLAIIIGVGSWSNILYPWMSKVMSFFSPIQAYIMLNSFWVAAVVGISFLTYKRICSCKEINITWFMVPMLYMSVQLIGNALLERAIILNLGWIWLLLGMNTLLFIVGFLWFHCLSVLVVVRIAQQSLTFAEINTFFVFVLGTVGVTVCTIFDLAKNLLLMGLLDSIQPLKLLACFFWGFGIWTVVFILILWCYQSWTKKMPIRVEWGIYIFSFQMYTIASHKIAEEFLSPLTSGVLSLLTLLLTVFWLCFWKNRIEALIQSTNYFEIKQKRSRV
ncbi:hypothetical protein [Desulfitobacterium sp. PCE1]|uniref:SLAC1 family transporter n=1 Tax=Desulfitobacterium sp. PCE1 TaxID=146907 RepID=UPI00036D7C67|nr:hypothetical protein [Desulfitobacterium sp. PCE1]